GLEPVELAVADRAAARQFAPGPAPVHCALDGIARYALPVGDVFFEAGDANGHGPPQVHLGDRPTRPCGMPADPAACREVLGEQRRDTCLERGESRDVRRVEQALVRGRYVEEQL